MRDRSSPVDRVLQWVDGLSTPAKAAVGVGFGVGVLAVARGMNAGIAAAHAGPAPESVGTQTVTATDHDIAIGDAHRALAAGTRVRMPGAFALRPSARSTSAPGDPTIAAGSIVTVQALAPSMHRGANETGYRVTVSGSGRSGFAFVPNTAIRLG